MTRVERREEREGEGSRKGGRRADWLFIARDLD